MEMQGTRKFNTEFNQLIKNSFKGYYIYLFKATDIYEVIFFSAENRNQG